MKGLWMTHTEFASSGTAARQLKSTKTVVGSEELELDMLTSKAQGGEESLQKGPQ
ncbi:hypothetical protein ACLOJK_008404 [Asimina triloba]